MASKSPPLNADQPGAAPSPSTIQDAAQQIWLAGLGAFAKAQEQGSKVFETLVKEGMTLQHQTQTAAEAKIAEAGRSMRAVSSEIQTQTEDRRDKLETIFEDRVSKALSRLGIPSITHIDALVARLDELEKCVQQMSRADTSAAPPAAPSLPQPKPSATPRTAAPNIVRPAARQKAASPKTPKAALHPKPLDIGAENPVATQHRKPRKPG